MSLPGTLPGTLPATLLESEALRVVERLGLRIPVHRVLPVASDGSEVDLDAFPGERLVVKAMAAGLLHKTEVGGVRVVPRCHEAVAAALADMRGRLGGPEGPLPGAGGGAADQGAGDLGTGGPGPTAFLVEAFVPHRQDPGGELLLGIRWTGEFGAVVTLGLGGTGVELLGRALPPGEGVASFSAHRDAAAVARALEGRLLTRLATGAIRGATGHGLDALAELVARAGAFALEHFPRDFVEIEVNPFVCTDEGPTALDAVVRPAPADGKIPPTAPRPLHRISSLMEPGSVAIMGVSERMNPGRIILRNTLARGFPPERVTVVKPGLETLDGCRCVPDLAGLGGPVDLLVLAVDASQIPDLMDEVVRERRAESVVLIPGGLGEQPGTADRAQRVADALAGVRGGPGWTGPVVNGANCLGVRSVPGRVDTLFIPPHKLSFPDVPPAPLALISQSGAFAIARATHLPELNPRHLVTVGTQIDLTVADWLEYLAEDPEVRVFAVYVEGFRPLDGLRLVRIAERLAREGRALVLYRAGRTAEGALATASHTASVAGDWAVTRELAGQAGALVAETLEDFQNLVRVSVAFHGRRPTGRGLGAMSNAGFEAVALADNLGPLRLADLEPATRTRLEETLRSRHLDAIVGVHNPLDVTPMMDDEGFATMAGTLLADPGVDVAVLGCVPLTPALTTLDRPDLGEDLDAPGGLGPRFARLAETSSTPWVSVVDAGPAYDAFARGLACAGIPVFRQADRALRALGPWVEWSLAAGPGARGGMGESEP